MYSFRDLQYYTNAYLRLMEYWIHKKSYTDFIVYLL